MQKKMAEILPIQARKIPALLPALLTIQAMKLPGVTNTATTRSNDTYVYGVGILAVLAIGVCVFFAYDTFQPKNKKIVIEKQDQQPKRLHVFKRPIINE